MHRLILMRHAQAESSGGDGGDRERPLSPQGRADAALMGRALAARGLRPDIALVSAALRTRQTWDAVEDALGDVEVRLEPDLYDAPAETLRRHVQDAEEAAGCLLVLAHNPGVHLLAHEYLVQGAASPALVDRLAGFPTGAAAVFAIDAAGRAACEVFLTPRDLGGERA